MPAIFTRGRTILFTLLLILVLGTSISWAKTNDQAFAVSKTVVKKFHLYATDGYVKLADGKKEYIWGYSLKNVKGTATYPGPKLTVNEGDRVEVTFTNLGPKKAGIKPMAHTIHFHGLDTNQRNDGVPDTHAPVQPGKSFTYKFTATHAGTYFYHCHVDTVQHLQMGMFGAFIIKAKNGAKQAWTGGPAYNKEYVMLMNEFDPVWHQAVAANKDYNRTNFHPRYWSFNGKSFPDTMNDPSTMITATVGQKVLIRLINSGYQEHSIHMHGFHFKVIASDGRPLPAPYLKDTLSIGPAERYDILVTFNQTGVFPLHSHNIVDNTNDGVYPGGLHTMICVKPKPTGKSNSPKGHSMASDSDPCKMMGGSHDSTGPDGIPVKISAMSVSVKELHVKVGDKVTWTNTDKQVHTVTSDSKVFNSGLIFPNKKWSYTFKKKGIYPYACTIHPNIKGKVIVE